MRITGGGVVGTFCVLALLAVVLVPLRWDSWRHRRVGRTLTVVVATLLTVLSAGLLVNAQGDFYPTVSSLFGANVSGLAVGRSGVVADVGDGDGRAVERAGRHRIGGRGEVVAVRFAGTRTHISRRGAVYLPAAYFDRTFAGYRFPVVELFHGTPGSPQSALEHLDLARFLDALISAGRMPPTVAVLPTTIDRPLQDDECVDAVGGVQDDTYLTTDVRLQVERSFRVRTDRHGWGLMGYSAGGFCAVNLAIRHPQWFSAAVSLSGDLRPYTAPNVGDLFHGNAAVRNANDPLWMITHRPQQQLAFYLTANDDERSEVAETVAFVRHLRPPSSAVYVHEHHGGHNFGTWRLEAPAALTWLAGQLGPPTLPPLPNRPQTTVQTVPEVRPPVLPATTYRRPRRG